MKNKLLHVLLLTSALSAPFTFANDEGDAEVSASHHSQVSQPNDDEDSSQLGAIAVDITTLQGEVVTLRAQLASDTESYAELDEAYNNLGLRFTVLDEEHARILAVLDEKNEAIAGLNEELEAKDEQITDLDARLDPMSKKIHELTEANSRLVEDNTQLTKILRKLQKNITAPVPAMPVAPVKKQIAKFESKTLARVAVENSSAEDVAEHSTSKSTAPVEETAVKSIEAITSAPVSELKKASGTEQPKSEEVTPTSVVTTKATMPSKDEMIAEMIAGIYDLRARNAEKSRLTHDVDAKALAKAYKTFKAMEAAAAAQDSDEEEGAN